MNHKLLPSLIFVVLLSFVSCNKDETIESIVEDIPRVPEVKTYEVSNINVFSVDMGGKIISQGDSDVLEAGLVIGESSQPTFEDNFTKFTLVPDEAGEFITLVTSLPTEITTFYIRAYAINQQGIAYGNEVQFTSLGNKIFNGDVTLSTQEEVIEFGTGNYNTINGSFYIKGSVTDLSPLKDLFVVNSAFEVTNTSDLKDFKGLENLKRTGAIFPNGFRIQYNQALIGFAGLKSLEITRGEFYVLNNKNLIDLSGLESFYAASAGNLFIRDCENLSSLSGLNKLEFIGDGLSIINNPKLKEIDALKNLNFIPRSININNNNSLQNIDGLEKVRDIKSITITGNSELTSLNGIKKVINLESIWLGGNLNLRELPEFENISRINSFQLSGNTGLINFNGLKNIKSFGQVKFFQTNIQSLKGLENLEEISTELEIRRCENLRNLDGLQNLKSVGDGGYYTGITIAENHNLTNFFGLNKLEHVKGSLIIFWNDFLESLNGLESLMTIEETLNISANKELNDLGAISNLEKLKGFTIIENNKLETLPNFTKLLEMETLHIDKGSSILKLDGFVSIRSIGSILIRDTEIYNLGKFENLERIEDYIEIERCKNLIDFIGLEKLAFAKKLNIWNNSSLKNLEGLNSLSEIGDEIDIRGNEALKSLKGLESISKVENNIKIYGNSTLSDFCSFKQFFTKETFGGFYGVENNLKNPTIEDIINGVCN